MNIRTPFVLLEVGRDELLGLAGPIQAAVDNPKAEARDDAKIHYLA